MADAPFTPRRELGRTGFAATALGIGDLADRAVPVEVCVATLRRALDAGLNVIDTAPNYADGYSEQIVGRAVRGGHRDSVFVVDKLDHHEQSVGPQIDGSLARLGLDRVDLFVFHDFSELAAFERPCQPGGVLDQPADAVRTGKRRFRGCRRTTRIGSAGMLLIFNPRTTLTGGELPAHGTTGPGHLALGIRPETLGDWRRRPAARGVVIEGEVSWPRGRHSLYFRDPAGNAVGLVTPGVWGTPAGW